jgi:hypothetical protein
MEQLANVTEVHQDRQEANARSRRDPNLQSLKDTICIKHLYFEGFDQMRPDTTLSFVDIPGINGSGLDSVSKEWVIRCCRGRSGRPARLQYDRPNHFDR